MQREIIFIDEEKCDGCGLCIPNCHEGALQVIDGKARLISDLFCDGLGACIGHCPQGAITMEKREAEPYNERKVMEQILPKGRNTILAHLEHLKEHNEEAFLKEALDFIKEFDVDLGDSVYTPAPANVVIGPGCGCGGSAPRDFRVEMPDTKADESEHSPYVVPTELKQWPVQLHLLNPMASYIRDSDLLLASDCSAFTMGGFHSRFMKGKSVAIACPKLDQGKDVYISKLATMISDAKVNTVTVVMMEVPCCHGLAQLVHLAIQQAGIKVPVKEVIMSIRGEVLSEVWM